MMSSGSHTSNSTVSSSRPADIESHTNGGKGVAEFANNDCWKEDGDLMNSVYNEMHEMKSSFRSVRTKLVIMFGLIALLALLGVIGSFAAFKSSNKVSVDGHTFRLQTRGGDDIGTMGIGQTFRLPMYTFPMGS